MDQSTPEEIRARGIREVAFDPLPPLPGHARRSLIPLKASGSTRPVFLVHGGHGQVFHFKRLAERVRDDIPIYGFEARGVRDGLEPVTSIPEMARDYVEEIRDIQPSGPYLIGGFSFGGMVAWEMARRLEAEGEEVRLLMIDIGPGNFEPPPVGRIEKFRRISQFHWHNWRGLEGERRARYRVEAFRNEVSRLSGFLGFDPAGRLYELSLKVGPKPRGDSQAAVLRTALAAIDDWAFSPIEQPVTLFQARLQPPESPVAPALGFTSELCGGGIDVRYVPGSHAFVFVEPHVNTVTAEFEAWVDRCDEPAAIAAAGRSASHNGPPVAEALMVADD